MCTIESDSFIEPIKFLSSVRHDCIIALWYPIFSATWDAARFELLTSANLDSNADFSSDAKTSSRLDCQRVKSDQPRLRRGLNRDHCRQPHIYRGASISVRFAGEIWPPVVRDSGGGDFQCLDGCDGHRRGTELCDGGDSVLNGGDSELNTSDSEAAPGRLPAVNIGKALADGTCEVFISSCISIVLKNKMYFRTSSTILRVFNTSQSSTREYGKGLAARHFSGFCAGFESEWSESLEVSGGVEILAVFLPLSLAGGAFGAVFVLPIFGFWGQSLSFDVDEHFCYQIVMHLIVLPSDPSSRNI
ncbi:RNA polymerase I specific transcriptioninitiation factor RRN3 protein [Striga asiatica]|uniref:RNA polymerase I specific transcriptioninitiation factor RRN3 protein n=1 Tax=Striga asiatica TaxID=4170 RepID=A0A5A7RL46_STRAF|nr:RNA polymerase I specific transcriptioninitiation factor RRN3 protein [Striga asiatica]